MNHIEKEILPELSPGKGCLILNLGFMPTYIYKDVLPFFEFQLGEEVMPMQMMFHRRHKGYFMISKKRNQGFYKCGYPVFFKFEEGEVLHKTLIIRAEDEDGNLVQHSLPLEIQVSNEKPVCGLSFELTQDGDILLSSWEKTSGKKAGSGKWKSHSLTNRDLDKTKTSLVNQSGIMFTYDTIIRPVAQPAEDLMVYATWPDEE